ncbi:MAG: alpha-2-macroglobulin [Bacteroidota bacterium]|nr:alpha-2-macroglobulin [Bacteroidota bacterium]
MLLLVIQCRSFAQSNYESLWKSVVKQEEGGMTKDALKTVENILDKSRKENNATQTVKSLLFKYRYMMSLEENSELKIVDDLKKEIDKSSGNDKAILQSILAELYFQYFSANTWKFSGRTETAEKQGDDFRTWDLKTLFKEINKYYLASLENKTLLQQTKLERYSTLLQEQKDSKKYRPTLYDLLAHRAIDYFSDDKSSLAEPSYAFAIDNKKYFETTSEFVNLKLSSRDTNSGTYNAIIIFQDLLRFHLRSDNSLDELADADLKRIKFVKEHYYNKEENETLYFDALQRMQKEYSKSPMGASINYEVALYIVSKNRAEQKDAGFKLTMKDALQICLETIKNYPNSEGAKNCSALKDDILNKNLSLNTEETVIPNEAFKSLVNFKNITGIFIRVIPISYEDRDRIFNLKNKETQKDILLRLMNITPVRNWKQELPVADDYMDHSVEIKMEPLKKGYYAILASTNEKFNINTGKEAVAVATLFSSQISFANKNNSGSSQKFEMHVLDRNSGQPLKGAEVKFYRNTYDYASRKYIRTNLGSVTADENGYVFRKTEKSSQNYNNENFQFDISYKDDFLPGEQSYYLYSYPNNENPVAQKTVHLFTDRSIYRPGQIIYFKGIVTQKDGEQYKILPAEKIKVRFRDVNYQEIKSQEFTTNDFGSFTGTFTAPTIGLLGNMTLETDFGSQSVQVEEYKRPKFEVSFEPVKKSFNLNDTVSVTGKATAYSGANIDHAEVKYSIRRVAEFPAWAWWGWRVPWYPRTPEKVISVGSTTTDDNGNFTVNFAAIPDLTISKTYKPYFNYEVSADVVDINGETHSSTTTIRVGYLAIEASLSVDDHLENEKENKITVTTNNLNGQPEPTEVTVKIYDLIEPATPKKARLWQEPDKFILSKQQHDNVFPYEVYDKEDLMENWQKGSLLNSYTFNTGKQSEIKLAPNILHSGAYMIEFSCKDKNGNAIEFKRTFLSSSLRDKTLSPKAFSFFKTDKASAKTGDTINVRIGSSMQNAFAIVEIGFKGSIIEKKTITLNNEIKTFSFPVKESYKGGVEINYILVNKNRIYSGGSFINVPGEDKSLRIEWLTFRDKLLPGSKEQWKLKISGPAKEKMTSELLAAMYDASLDAFLPHSWDFSLGQPSYNGYLGTYASDAFGMKGSELYTSTDWNIYKEYYLHGYDNLNLFGLQLAGYRRYYRGSAKSTKNTQAIEAASVAMDAAAGMAEEKMENVVVTANAAPPMPQSALKKQDETKPLPVKPDIAPRTNLNETAFFFPQLQTDAEGNTILNFQMPEALTKWNFLGLAHTKDLHYEYFTKSVVTQKQLMVVPNAPRFLREGDDMEFSAKISNLTDTILSGTADLIIYDAVTMKEITWKLVEAMPGKITTIGERDFFARKGSSTVITWRMHIPEGIEAITYKVIAQAGDFSDGEQASLVVLPNRMMVTETMPLWVRGGDKKSYTFDKLLNTKSPTLKNYKLTLEMSSQPVWYAVQALPYMMEYPHECSEQLFSRYYANTLATYIANQNPKIKSIFDKWKNTDALVSNLEKNQELKSVILEETPWVRDAQNETEQKKRIALLFDLTRMSQEQQTAFDKLIQMQTPNGGFTWFPGMPDNRYITQHIIAGFGHLAKLDVLKVNDNPRISDMLQKAVSYLDDRLREDFEQIKKYDKDYLKTNHLWYTTIHALYARSFFDYKISSQNKDAYDYFYAQAKQYWLQQDLYSKGMIALALQRNNEKTIADKIITSLKQNAINSEELGMYWKSNEAGWYWYQAPVETQALLIEAFHEVSGDNKSVDEMKVWLLKQKQTTSWKSTKATAEACYALLLQGKDWTNSEQLVEVTMDGNKIDPVAMGATVEPGTGYYKINWKAEEIKPSMAKIQLRKKDKGPAWGAMYWQYFEDLDKITGATTSLQLIKKLFREENTSEGKKLFPITEDTPLSVGDIVKVRIELRTDRNMEYVHMKDMRAAGFEPVNVLSAYKYQDGLGYYESTKDVATHFFMDWLPKGVYVFEYAMRATIAGNFSNGITLIESMYAPEFKSHSKGERVTIAAKK